MSKVNHEQIARRLKVSRATVTRSLAGYPSIAAGTRERVLRAAAELGYEASPARVLRKKHLGKDMCVGVLVGVRAPEPGTATFPYIIEGIREQAAHEQVCIDVYHQNPDEFDLSSRRHRIFGHMRTAKWRGAILIYPFDEEAIRLLSRRIPTVATLEDYLSLNVDSIDTDHSAGVLKLIGRLVAQGHRRIGFAAWHYPIGGHWTRRRYAACIEGFCAAGLPINSAWAFNVHAAQPVLDTWQLAQAVARVTREEGVSAWVCAADHQAYALIRDLGLLGLRVPEDCSITGFDGIEPAFGLPQATTVSVPHREIGSASLLQLLHRIRYPETPNRNTLVDVSLVPGRSSAPPRPD
jgi:DNA-binding LacI/PurR family transcriptional regulator